MIMQYPWTVDAYRSPPQRNQSVKVINRIIHQISALSVMAAGNILNSLKRQRFGLPASAPKMAIIATIPR